MQELRPVAFHARTMIDAELNYDIYDKELLAIFKAFRQWRAYLEGAKYEIQVFSDHTVDVVIMIQPYPSYWCKWGVHFLQQVAASKNGCIHLRYTDPRLRSG
jgi:hypothetical protein